MAFGPRIELPPIVRDERELPLVLGAVEARHFGEHIPSREEIKRATPYVSSNSISIAASLRKRAPNPYYEHMKTDPRSVRWGVLIDDQLNGFAGYEWDGMNRERAASVFIEIFNASWQAQGVGTTIAPAVIDHAFRSGFEQLNAYIDLENDASLKLANKMGYVCLKHDYYEPYGRNRKMHHLALKNPRSLSP